MNRPSYNAPLRLTGGGDTSFECQDDENVNFTSTSSPFFECREITSSMEGQGIGSFDNVILFPGGEMRMKDMPWEDTMISDTSSSSPYPQDISTPVESSNESTLSTLAELEPMADHFIPPLANLNPLADPFIPFLDDFSFSDTNLSASIGNVSDGDDPLSVLAGLKEKNQERPIIAHLNINSISSKFEPFMALIKDTIDFLLVTESKLDDTFPPDQFKIEGFSRPVRLDRNRNGGGLIIFVRDGLTCKELTPRKLYL